MKTINFACGSVTENPILEKTLSKAIAKIDVKKLLKYEQPLGTKELRQEIINLHQVDIDEDNVMITSSAQQALVIVINYLKKRQTPLLLVQEPTYFGMIRLVKEINIPIETFQKIDEVLARKNITPKSVIYLTSNFHNPTGHSLNNQEKIRLSAFVKKYDLMIIEDNPHDFIYFTKRQPSKLFCLDIKKTIYINGFSKILAPGLRIGYVITAQEVIQNLKSEKISQDIFTSTIGQQVCLIALQNKKYLDELRFSFKTKKNLVVKLLKKYFKDTEVKWNNPKGGIFILIKFPSDISMKKISEIAKNKYNLILENDQFTYLDNISKNQTRINFVKNNGEVTREGVEKLYLSFKEAKQ